MWCIGSCWKMKGPRWLQHLTACWSVARRPYWSFPRPLQMTPSTSQWLIVIIYMNRQLEALSCFQYLQSFKKSLKCEMSSGVLLLHASSMWLEMLIHSVCPILDEVKWLCAFLLDSKCIMIFKSNLFLVTKANLFFTYQNQLVLCLSCLPLSACHKAAANSFSQEAFLLQALRCSTYAK